MISWIYFQLFFPICPARLSSAKRRISFSYPIKIYFRKTWYLEHIIVIFLASLFSGSMHSPQTHSPPTDRWLTLRFTQKCLDLSRTERYFSESSLRTGFVCACVFMCLPCLIHLINRMVFWRSMWKWIGVWAWYARVFPLLVGTLPQPLPV